MDVVLIAHFCGDFDSEDNNRFNYLADLLACNDCSVELITSDFSHTKKRKRSPLQNELNFRVTFIAEPGYEKNVSFKRLYSHYVMGLNLKKYLMNRKIPDVIYCAVPSLDIAGVAAKYAKTQGVRFIIDVQDIWPEAFKLALPIPIISDILFYPMQKKANCIYGAADEIVAVSQTYMDRAMLANIKGPGGHTVFLGTDLRKFDQISTVQPLAIKPDDEIWLAYIGTLGHSYDIKCVVDAVKFAQETCNIKFVVMGDGPLKEVFQAYAQEQGIFAEFTGKLDYAKMAAILKICDIAVNPIARGAAGSIISKVGDYAAAGLPVLNTQECAEYRALVDVYKIGINCENGKAKDLADKLVILCNDGEMRKKMGTNNRKLAEARFDRGQTYRELVEVIVKGGDFAK